MRAEACPWDLLEVSHLGGDDAEHLGVVKRGVGAGWLGRDDVRVAEEPMKRRRLAGGQL